MRNRRGRVGAGVWTIRSYFRFVGVGRRLADLPGDVSVRGMAGKLKPAAQAKLSEMETLFQRAHRCHALVEQYAASRGTTDTISIKRSFGDLKRSCMGGGFDAQAQLAGAMEIAAGRGASASTKIRILREGIASIKFQLELEQRAIIRDGQPDKPEE